MSALIGTTCAAPDRRQQPSTVSSLWWAVVAGSGQGRGRGRGRGVFTSAAAPVTRPGAGRGRGEAEQEKAESGPAAAAAARDHAATTATWPQWQQRATLPSIGATNTGCPAVVCSVRCIQGVVLCNLCRSRVPGRRQRRGAAERRPQPEPERGRAGRPSCPARLQWLVRGEPPAGPVVRDPAAALAAVTGPNMD